MSPIRHPHNLIILAAALIIAAICYFAFVQGVALPAGTSTSSPAVAAALAACGSLPNASVQDEITTDRLFINLPKAYFDAENISDRFTTVGGNATAGYVSSGGAPGNSIQETQGCWSTYYEFDGTGEVDLNVPGIASDTPPYVVRFIVNANATGAGATGTSSSPVILISATPAVGNVNERITLTGSGFTADNTVLFNGNVAAMDVHLTSFTNGHQTITFSVPAALAPDCKAGQACPQYRIAVTPDTYQIAIQNENGVSADLPFIVEGE